MEQASEAIFIQRAQGGDTEAFGELVLAHQRFVYNLALRAVNDPVEAQDVAQEAFLRAWMALARFRAQARFRTWLYRIVVNLCYNRRPRLQRELAALPVDEALNLPADETDDPAFRLEDDELRAFLHQQIEQLPASYRLLVSLRYQQDLDYKEIATILSMLLGTVKIGLFRARALLRAALRAREETQHG